MDDHIYLAHHGIKGMKWGIRRFQNPDGTLTAAGKKRYYGQDGRLSRAGNKFNRAQREKLKAYKEATRYNVSRANPEFNKELSQFKSLKAQNSRFAREEEAKWLSDSDYKGLDYYQFKDERSRRFDETENGKKYLESALRLRKMVDSTASEHPLYNRSYKELRGYTSQDIEDDFVTVDYGRTVVDQIMNKFFCLIIF